MFRNREKWSEKELLIQVADGNEQAFSVLIERYGNLLGLYIFKITHSRETAEEVVQDVFFKIWQNRESLPEINNFKVWVYVISRNQAVMALRKIIRERLNSETIINPTELEDQEENQEKQWDTLERAVDLLPPQQKKAYILSRREGFSYNEIAQEMGISRETVKKHLRSATLFLVAKVREFVAVSG